MSARDEESRYETYRDEWERQYLAEGGGTRIPEGFTVRLTCVACPEQWDIAYDGVPIGYLRCRGSRWSLWYPDVGDECLIAEDWHPERGPYESNFDDERPEIFGRVFAALVERRLRR